MIFEPLKCKGSELIPGDFQIDQIVGKDVDLIAYTALHLGVFAVLFTYPQLAP
jgi:hypothetical protein